MSIYGFPGTVNDRSRIGGAVFRRIFGVLSSQLQGVLTAVGDGVVFGFEVEANDSGGVTVTPGGGVVEAADLGGRVWLQSEGATVAWPVDAERRFLFAVAEEATQAYAPDSRETALPLLVWDEGQLRDGGLLLAERQTDGTLLDRRSFSPVSGLGRRVAQLETDVGYDPTERDKGSVAARLNGLLDADDEGTPAPEDVSRAEFSALKTLVLSLQERLNALGGDPTLEGRSDVDRLRLEMLQLGGALAEVNERYTDDSTISYDIPGLTGAGQRRGDGSFGPDVVLGGNAVEGDRFVSAGNGGDD